MEKPSEFSGTVFPKIPGSHGGRPPDLMPAPTASAVSGKDVQVLERHGSPIPSEVMPMAKRGRTGTASGCDSMEDGKEVSDYDTSMGEVDASTNLKGSTDNPVQTMGPSLVQVRHDDGQPKLSFRDSLLGKDGGRSTLQTISELDVEDLCGKDTAGIKNPEVEVGRDPKELYGPWMQVTNRRRRGSGSHKNVDTTTTAMTAPVTRGSRFAILQDPQGIEHAICPVTNGMDMQLSVASCDLPATLTLKGKETISAPFHGEGNSGPGSFSGGIVSENISGEMVMDLDANLNANLNGPIDKEVGGLVLENVKAVASSERIVTSDITLNQENHTAVRIGESSKANRIKERRGRVLSASFWGGGSKAQTKIASALKSNLKQGPKPKKRDDRGPANPSLAGRISALVSELDKAKAAEAVWLDECNPLASIATGAANTSPVQVVDLVDENRGWDWQQIAQWLPPKAVGKLAAVKPPRADAGPDISGWRWGENRDFTVRSAYQILHAPVLPRLLITFSVLVHERVNAGRLLFAQVNLLFSSHSPSLSGYSLVCLLAIPSAMVMAFGPPVFPCFAGLYGSGIALRSLARIFHQTLLGYILVSHVKRCINLVADKLAFLSRDKDLGEELLDSPPMEVLDLLHQDMSGVNS
ncbi:hypothetical protein V6N11_075475 [Hibiscus sabdariffa]|uniref:Uncharacterized protein n=1 Tax=Hibiscus sabdariffa TaxID=183260 RepID=A0ABR2R750_9ROSI